MSRYHINPKTGNPNLCRAEKNCPFGEKHFDSKVEAREAYEAEQDPFSSAGFAKAHKEELLPELAAWVEPGPLGNFLNHPLVQDMMVDAMPGFANMRLKDKQRRVAAAIEAEDWNTFIFLHERPYRFQALEEAIYDHGVDEPHKLIRSAWIDSENIHQNHEGWGELLREHGVAMESSEEAVLAGLPEEVVIYRGCTKAGENGYSWTLDKERAEWFARRFSRSGAQLLETKIPKTAVVAYIDSRNESEIVVLPENVVRESLRRTRL